MIAGTGADGSQNAESVVSDSERSQLRQPRITSNIVPNDSQQTDRWQDVFPLVVLL